MGRRQARKRRRQGHPARHPVTASADRCGEVVFLVTLDGAPCPVCGTPMQIGLEAGEPEPLELGCMWDHEAGA
jgi:hypothetical protein